MNERIKQLALKAGCRSRKFTTGVSMYPNVDADLQKFAELIVRECAQVIQDKNDIENYLDSWDHGFVAGLATAIDAIEQHFGVES
jgi:hypothetical protein